MADRGRPTKHNVRMVIYIPPDISESIRVEAERTGKSFGEIVELALKEGRVTVMRSIHRDH